MGDHSKLPKLDNLQQADREILKASHLFQSLRTATSSRAQLSFIRIMSFLKGQVSRLQRNTLRLKTINKSKVRFKFWHQMLEFHLQQRNQLPARMQCRLSKILCVARQVASRYTLNRKHRRTEASKKSNRLIKRSRKSYSKLYLMCNSVS